MLGDEDEEGAFSKRASHKMSAVSDGSQYFSNSKKSRMNNTSILVEDAEDAAANGGGSRPTGKPALKINAKNSYLGLQRQRSRSVPALEEDSDAGGESPRIVEENGPGDKPAINSGLLALKQPGADSRNTAEKLTSLSERNRAQTEAQSTGGKPAGLSLGQGGFSPRVGLTLKQPKKGGGMAARRGKLNLSGVPGLGSASKLEFIHGKANELAARREEQESKGFDS